MRLLLNPEQVEGTPPPEAPVTKAETAPSPPSPPPAPPAPNPLAADLAATRARLKELEDAEAKRAEDDRLAEEEKLKAKGEFEKLIKQRDEALAKEKKAAADAVERSKAYALDSQIATAFAGHDLYEGSAEDLAELWRKDFEVVADGEKWAVRSKDGRSAKEVIAERLASPRYANHVKATARSGAGGGGGDKPSPTPSTDRDRQPSNYEEYQRMVLQIDEGRNSPTIGLTGRRPAR